MFLKPRRPTTDPRLRSLLQKAARRGAVAVAEQSARCLDAMGDKTWLRSRAVVITFEESWPCASTLALDRTPVSKRDALLVVAKIVKQKDAAGLGALSHALSEKDT